MPDISRLVIKVDSKSVVTATDNLDKFTKASDKAGKSSSGFSDKFRSTGKDVDDLAEKFGTFQLVIDKLPGPMKSIAAAMLGLVSPATAAVSALLELGETAVQSARESVQAFSDFEMIKTNLEVVMGSAEQASITFNALSKMAGRTPFNVQQLTEVATLLKQTGTAAGDLIPTLEILGNVSGGSMEKFNRIAFNFAQVQSQMKATALDIRQFAMAGVPIIKVLEEMGVTGNATAEQVTEAFRVMTSEGGTFFNAMEKGAQTLTGMKTNLEGLAQQYKALYAEVRGLADMSKWFTGLKTDFLKYRLDELLMIKEALENINQLTSWNYSSRYDAMEFFQNIDLNELIYAAKYTGVGISGNDMTALKNILARKDAMRDEMEGLKSIIEQEKNRTAEIGKQLKLIDNIRNAYNTTMGDVNEIYAKTTQGQIETIQAEIDKLMRFRDANQKIELRYSVDSATGKLFTRDMVTELSKADRSRIDAVIEYWKEQLENIEIKLKDPIADWAKVLSQVTGYNEDDIYYEWGGLETVNKYIEEAAKLTDLMNSMPSLYDALELDRLDVLEGFADKLREALQAMAASGLWDGTEESFQTLLAALNKAEELSSEEKLIRTFEELQKTIDLIKASTIDPMATVIQNIINSLKDADIINPTHDTIEKIINKNGKLAIAELEKQLVNAGKTTRGLMVENIMVEKSITKEMAEQSYLLQEQIDYIINGYDIMGEITTSINDALRSIRSGNGGYGQYAGAKFAEAGMNSIQGSDAGNFAQGMTQGGWIVGLFNMLAGAITNVLNSIEGTDEILNPITNSLMQMKDIFKAVLLPGLMLSRIFTALGEVSNILLNAFSFGLIDVMSEAYDSLVGTNDEREIEEERLRALNEQYSNLFLALKEQEEYYLQQRRHLNAEWAIDQYQTRSVNDMILSPHGAFSTSPEDYIIATKHPETLMGGGGGNVYVNVTNNANVNVSTQESIKSDGTKVVDIFIDAVKREFVNGGMDGIMDAVSARRGGRRQHA